MSKPPATRKSGAAPELLAPAGDWDSLRAAIAAGADAVYFGLQAGFNARARAANFAAHELRDVMAELRGQGCRGYLTLNTLVFSDEWSALETVVRQAADAGVDAVLVQDFGAAQLIRAVCPSLELHASTQMTLASAESIEVARRLGIARVVLPRELTVDQIRAVRRACNLGLEVFVHGALCISFSGQCAASLSLGGRSANRGRCAQACRLPCRLQRDGQSIGATGAYPLSPNDLAALDVIPQLMDVGVDALKIEGRMKGPDYVFAVASAYRKAIDRWRGKTMAQPNGEIPSPPTRSPSEPRRGAALPDDNRHGVPAAEAESFAGTFSRGFCRGWLEHERPTDLVTGLRPGHRGQYVGTIEAVSPPVIPAASPKEGNRRSGRQAMQASKRSPSREASCPNGAKGPNDRTRPASPTIRLRLAADLALGDGIAIHIHHFDPTRQAPSRAGDRNKPHKPPTKADRNRSDAFTMPSTTETLGGRVVALFSFPEGLELEKASKGQTVQLVVGRLSRAMEKLQPGMEVFKTDDSMAEPPPQKKIAIDLVVQAVTGKPLTLTARCPDGRVVTVSSPEPLASASQRPTDSESVAAAASRFGDTPFAVCRLDVQIEGAPLVPLSSVNRLRRDLIAILLETRRPPSRPTLPESPLSELRRQARQALCARTDRTRQPTAAGRSRPSLAVLCRSIEQVAATLNAGCDELIVDLADLSDWVEAARLCRQAKADWLAAVPRIHKPGESPLIERLIELQPDGVVARNLASLAMAASRGANVVADYSLNAVNELSVAWLAEQGASRVTVALDAFLGSIDQWIEHLPAELLEMVLHLHVPMFHSAYCPYSAAARGRTAACSSDAGGPQSKCGGAADQPARRNARAWPRARGDAAREYEADERGLEARPCRGRCRRGRWRIADRMGIEHFLWPDLTCRVTVFHAWPQSAVEWAHRLASHGIRHFRVEWPPEMPLEKLAPTLDIYREVLDGRCDGPAGWRRLRELFPGGITRGLWRQSRPSRPSAEA